MSSSLADEKAKQRGARFIKVESHRQQILSRVRGAAGASSSASAGLSKLHKREDFLAQHSFISPLPPLPVDVRGNAFPFDDDLHSAYDMIHGLSGATEVPRLLYAEPDLGVGIPLMDPLVYTLPSGPMPPMDSVDKKICGTEFSQPAKRKEGFQGLDPSKFEWLMLSQHLHNDLYDSVYKHAGMVVTQKEFLEKSRQEAKKQAQARGSRAQLIEESFEAMSAEAAVPLHPIQPKLQVKRAWEVMPDANAQGQHYFSVTFDADPSIDRDGDEGRSRASGTARPQQPPQTPSQKRARVSHSVLLLSTSQPVEKKENSSVFHLLLPKTDVAEEFQEKEERGEEHDDPLPLTVTRDYVVAIERCRAGAASATESGHGEETFVFVLDDNQLEARFAPVEFRANLVRKPHMAGSSSSGSASGIGSQRLGGSAHIVKRALVEEEEEDKEAWEASIDLPDPTEVLEKLRKKKLARKQARSEAIESSVNSSRNGAASAGGGSDGVSGRIRGGMNEDGAALDKTVIVGADANTDVTRSEQTEQGKADLNDEDLFGVEADEDE